jgi:hypothetical protein
MRIKISVIWLSFYFTLLAVPQVLWAQPVGSPILTQSHKEFTVSLLGGYVRKNIERIQNNSPRYLLRTAYGLAEFIDLFVDVGFTKVSLVTLDEDITNFEGKYNLAYGGGIKIRLLNIRPYRFSIFTSGQVFRFITTPSSEELLTIGGGEISKIRELHYDWRELQINLGTTKGWGVVRLYSGLNAKFIQRLETQVEKIVVNGIGESENSQNGEYLSGLETSPFAGVDFNLPSRYKLSFEIVGRNRSDLAFYIGISQTGQP